MANAVAVTTVFTPASTYDLTTLDVVKDELSVVTNSDDARLKRYLSMSSAAVTDYCNRVFPAETIKDEFWPARDPAPRIIPGGPDVLKLSRWPIIGSPSTAGIAPPLAAVPVAVAGGALAAATAYVRISYVTAAGETAASDEVALNAAANNLVQVPSPVLDQGPLATGWNVYAANKQGAETKQNAAPIAIGTAWTQAASGFIAGSAVPNYALVVENAIPLAEGVDFRVDYTRGQLSRLDGTPYPKSWNALPIVTIYPAGFAVIPSQIVDATLRMVRARSLAKNRDPFLRSEVVTGVREAQYWIPAGEDGGNMSLDVTDLLDNFRVPVVG